MGPLDALGHLLNLFLPAWGLAAVSAGLAKLLWRRELKPVSPRRLVVPAGVVGSVLTLAGLVVFGRDGKMATYAAVVVGCALSLWWRGFGPGRR